MVKKICDGRHHLRYSVYSRCYSHKIIVYRNSFFQGKCQYVTFISDHPVFVKGHIQVGHLTV